VKEPRNKCLVHVQLPEGMMVGTAETFGGVVLAPFLVTVTKY
jgi:hypothetical protein